VGTPLPEDWKSHVLEWYTKPGRLHLDRGVVVVLFWETWCPHCKREIPKWESTARRYAEQGLTVVGLTRLTRSATRETATRFVEEHHLGFPLGQEDGSFASAAEVSGIPAAAVYRDGLLIWRGHPARITDALLTGWLEPQ
jgi:thiol-disulfide isomerase/thioredoxin